MRKDLDQEILIRARGASTEVMSQVLSNLPNSEEDRQGFPQKTRARFGASPLVRRGTAYFRDVFAITPTVSVIIPARNEAANLPHVLGTLPTWVDEVVLVEGIPLMTPSPSPGRCAPGPRRRPSPAAARGRVEGRFRGRDGEILVAIDADGSTDGAEIIRFVGALGPALTSPGLAFRERGGSDDITGLRGYGNRMLSTLVNRMFGTHFTDLCYGYNAFWARDLDAVGSSSARASRSRR